MAGDADAYHGASPNANANAPASTPYAAPTPSTAAKLIDTDTAEASALPDGLKPSSRLSLAASDVVSRPASAASMRVRVERPTNHAISDRGLYAHVPTGFEDAAIETGPRSVAEIFARRGGAPAYGQLSLRARLRLFWTQLVANALSSFFLSLVVVWALSVRILAALPSLLLDRGASSARRKQQQYREWDEPRKHKRERLVKDVKYYAKSCGFEIRDEVVETNDGYFLRVHRVIDPQRAHERHADGKGGFPVLIMHGLFQSSGSFVTSEERSLAFWLARQGGYQVFLGNNRGVFDMGHRKFRRSDPRFWDYNIRELAVYDLPALVDYVCKQTGYEKIAFIGHSQGNGTAFISLSQGMVPELGEKLSYFAALAPAVYAGPLTSCFPFTALRDMEWPTWKRFFGVLDFIPLMKWSYDLTPALPYALLGYQMFAFLFAWTDANWLLRRKAKMFRFTPQPVSSASIYWWAGKDGFSTRGCTLDPNAEKWWDSRFPPLAIFSGGMDFLVLTEPLLERIQTKETDVRLLRAKRQEQGEHCDHFWAADAVEWCFYDLLEDIEATRPRYPEELNDGAPASSAETEAPASAAGKQWSSSLSSSATTVGRHEGNGGTAAAAAQREAKLIDTD